MDALDDGQSVLVSAPTGSGKTIVAEYAAACALERGGKAFYTTPIKALSNQKFAELARRHGDGRVGLLTGDVSHQAHAPIVVMTTEVLRNMLFARSPVLDGLEVVVLDEVHYLQDPYRGSVWEEVLVLTPPGVTVREPVGHGEQRRRLRGLAVVGVRQDPGHRGDPPPGRAAQPLCRGRTGTGRAHRVAAAPRRAGQSRRPVPRRPAPSQPPAPVPGAPPGRGHRVPGRRRHAARHHLHLLEGGLRRCRPPVPAGRHPADHAGRAPPDPGAHRGGGGPARGRRPPHPRATGRGRRPWRPASLPITPDWSRPSARPSSSASPRAC